MAVESFIAQNKISLSTDESFIFILDSSSKVSLGLIEKFSLILDKERQNKAKRFKYRGDYNNCMLSHIALKILLGEILGCEPEKVSIQEVGGKAVLGEEFAHENVKFNISHTDGAVMIGVSRAGEIGVDIEKVKSGIDILPIVESYFEQKEYEDILLNEKSGNRKHFYKYWTLKEAVLKAVGLGLAGDLKEIVIGGSISGGRANEIFLPKAYGEASSWQVSKVEMLSQYCAAVAVWGARAADSKISLCVALPEVSLQPSYSITPLNVTSG